MLVYTYRLPLRETIGLARKKYVVEDGIVAA